MLAMSALLSFFSKGQEEEEKLSNQNLSAKTVNFFLFFFFFSNTLFKNLVFISCFLPRKQDRKAQFVVSKNRATPQ